MMILCIDYIFLRVLVEGIIKEGVRIFVHLCS